MKSLYDPEEAREVVRTYPSIPEVLALRVYTSRLIGKNPDLVLHGGGNTSVKLRLKNVLGEERDVLFMKGSGVDMATIEPEGLVGLELDPLRKLRTLETLSDDEMENELQIHKIFHRSPDPSVETLLHAFLPHRYIDHTHADSILNLTHQKHGEEHVRNALGPDIRVLPYLTSGFPLAKGVLEAYEHHPGVDAIVVLNHGIFTFGEDLRDVYEKMIECVSRAESYIESKIRGKRLFTPRRDLRQPEDLSSSAARMVQAVRGASAFRTTEGRLQRFYTEIRSSSDLVEASLSREAQALCSSGALTYDHVIRTKNLAVAFDGLPEQESDLLEKVRDCLNRYVAQYDQYFSVQSEAKKGGREKRDPFPRIFLVAGIGIMALGETRRAARMAADIAEHTFRTKIRAMALGEYVPLEASHVFDMEYWSLQQKKLGKVPPPPLRGQVALVTGGGGAIGLGIADRLIQAGAVTVLSDFDPARLEKVHSILVNRYGNDQVEKIVFDVTDYESVEKAFADVSRRVGGLDILVPNAGTAHVARIEDLPPKTFENVTAVNLMGTFHVIKASIPIFRRQGTGGNIIVISSKNVFDPGASFGAYSASKAAAHQISKIAALELADLGVRVNMVNPDAIFGDEEVSSRLWDLVGPERMKARGLDPEGLQEFYRQRNLLKARVLAEHVGNVVVFFASDLTPTTGASFPVDGGIPAAFPR